MRRDMADEADATTPPEEVEEPIEEVEEPEPLPTHKPDLVALAIEHGVPSYEAWDMTVKQLTKRLES
jgi:hypothetical protein